jgi:hypothetical protein
MGAWPGRELTMRLGEWEESAPVPGALAPRVVEAIRKVVTPLAGDPDPDLWIAWGEDPGVRFTLFVPLRVGLLVAAVRVSVPGEGPWVSAKVVRWSRVQMGEVALEGGSGHRLASFQLEGTVIRGVDAEADRIAAFARRVLAAMEGEWDAATPPARPS